MDKDGKHCGFNNDFGLNAMRLCRRIVTEGGMTMRDYEQSRQQFVAGKIGIIAPHPTQPVPLRILSAASSSSDARFIRV